MEPLELSVEEDAFRAKLKENAEKMIIASNTNAMVNDLGDPKSTLTPLAFLVFPRILDLLNVGRI